MLKCAFNVKGDHSWTAGALFLHHCMLGVRGQAYGETANIDRHVYKVKFIFKKRPQMEDQFDANIE